MLKYYLPLLVFYILRSSFQKDIIIELAVRAVKFKVWHFAPLAFRGVSSYNIF